MSSTTIRSRITTVSSDELKSMLPACDKEIELNSDVNRAILDYGVWSISALFTIDGVRVWLRHVKRYPIDRYERIVLNQDPGDTDLTLLKDIVEANPEPFKAVRVA